MRLSRRFWIAGATALAWALGPVFTAVGESPGGHAAHVLRLRSGRVDTSRQPDQRAARAGSPGGRYVIQLDAPASPDARARLERAGVRLGDYLPERAYIARLTGTTAAAVRALPGVRWVDRFRAEWKLDPDLGARFAGPGLVGHAGLPEGKTAALRAGRAALFDAGKTQVLISLFPGEDLGQAAGVISALNGVEVRATNAAGARGMIDAIVPLSSLDALAALGAVQFVEEAPWGTLRNTNTRWVVQSNVSLQTPLWDMGLHGEDQIAGLIDSEVWESHCAFDDTVPIGPAHRKIVAYRGAMGQHSHGTHTAGTLAGDLGVRGTADPVDGLAFAAKLSFSLYWDVAATPSLLYPFLEAAHLDGARVHSNSWGDDGTTAYTTWCEQADRFSRDHEESLVVFAATNTSTLKTPENAKNVLAVGATFQAPNQDSKYSGGSGPTADSRRKPEVFAPGAGIVSASYFLQCGTYTTGGTSMATPAVAGMAVLARQYFTEGHYPSGSATPGDAFTPSGALLKASVINSAVDMVNVAGYPSNAEGWGRLLMDNVLYFAGEARGLFAVDVLNSNGFSTGAFETYHVDVTSASEPLKITMVFTDVPGTVNASDPVVNNLDLVVTGPLTVSSNGPEYLGNVFTGGESTTGGAADPRNNVEQVHLSSPGLGLYTIEVRGTAVNQSTQGFALVATGALVQANPPVGSGDYDFDGDVDLLDFATFQRCFTGMDNGPIHAGCQSGDMDGDRDVDAVDTASWTGALTGP